MKHSETQYDVYQQLVKDTKRANKLLNWGLILFWIVLPAIVGYFGYLLYCISVPCNPWPFK